jgi:glycosyltransferase involved in cell wall biosynthesis
MLQYVSSFTQAGFVVTVEPLLSNRYISEMQRGRRDVISVLKGYLNRIRILLSRKYSSYDLIWIEKEIFPWFPHWFEKALLGDRLPYILDYDDAVFNLYSENRYWFIRASLKDKHRKLQKNAAYISVGSRYLAEYVKESTNKVVEVPSVIDLDRYSLLSNVKPVQQSRVPRIIWIGQKSTSIFLRPYVSLLQNLIDEGLISVTCVGFDVNQLGLSCTYIPWSEEGEVAALQACDIGISPLPDGSFERGKCGYKLIQYMAAGLPVVASKVGEHINILVNQTAGYLVETQSDWERALRTLIADPCLSQKMGAEARKLVEQKYSIQVTHSVLINLFQSLRYEPLVSIITPAFNAARMIRDTIESVRDQTYQNWEMIIVDDKSTDETVDIIKEIAAEDERIRLICLAANLGYPGLVKNVALKHIRGELIAFLDADDTWLPCKLKDQVKCMEDSTIDLCYSGGMFVDDNLNPLSKFMPRYGDGWIFDRLLAQYEINNQTVVVRSGSIARLTLPFFKPSLRIGEDYDLFMRIASSGNLVSLKNDHVRYRVHSDSVSMRFALDATGGLKEVLSWTQRDPMLSQRCRPFLKYAQAKVAYYEAKAAMSEGQQLSAQSYLRPFAFVNWRYFILYSGTKSFVLWRFLLRFDRRNITS